MKSLLVLVVVAAIAALPGCGSPDDRLSDMARQTTHEQAQQNQRIAEGSKAIAEGSKQLVEADAHARRDVIGLQQDLRHPEQPGWLLLVRRRLRRLRGHDEVQARREVEPKGAARPSTV